MKKWIQPQAEVQLFVANEYVAACWKVSCAIPAEQGLTKIENGVTVTYGFDPKAPNDMTNLHRSNHCGSDDGFEIKTDESGMPISFKHITPGSTNNERPLDSNLFTDSSYSAHRDLKTVSVGETIYFTTVNGHTWHHHGKVLANGNHS